MIAPRWTKGILGAVVLLAACSAEESARSCPTGTECSPGETCVSGMCRARGDAGGTGDAGDTGGMSDAARDAVVDVAPGPPDVARADAGDGGPPCTRTETPEHTCNGLDDDCNGFVDDVDTGSDGICDCLRVGIMGAPGSNASSSFQAWIMARGSTATRFGLDATVLTPAQLAAFDVVILDQLQREYTPAEAGSLREFVAAGGGVMSMTGYTNEVTDRTRPNSLLGVLGLSYIDGLLNGPVTMFTPHRLTMGLTSVTFLGGFRVGEVSGGSGSNTVVARLADGPVGIAQEHGRGRVFVWGDEWVEFDSEWSTMPEIARFWVNTLDWLGPQDRCRGPG